MESGNHSMMLLHCTIASTICESNGNSAKMSILVFLQYVFISSDIFEFISDLFIITQLLRLNLLVISIVRFKSCNPEILGSVTMIT